MMEESSRKRANIEKQKKKKKQRKVAACQNCHKSKKKCEGKKPCKRCKLKKLECVDFKPLTKDRMDELYENMGGIGDQKGIEQEKMEENFVEFTQSNHRVVNKEGILLWCSNCCGFFVREDDKLCCQCGEKLFLDFSLKSEESLSTSKTLSEDI